ncbi:hypothetical protein [Marinoscillum sp. 108]|uniref:hypothetical protein n=1 Tax=Marinoscillum sp. 108 TaxID=2653151 RepID=UPI0012F1CC15|nr:hypothetical protein [Marinoscillum sp. 108]VXD12331.1 hypothetical protein MARINOS108_10984 [Marinoscillum sp. 108]
MRFLVIFCVLLSILFTSCKEKDSGIIAHNRESISDFTFKGAENRFAGCMHTSERKVKLSLWAGNNFSVNKSFAVYLNNGDHPIMEGTLPLIRNDLEMNFMLAYTGFNNLIIHYPDSKVTTPVEVGIRINESTHSVYFDDTYNGYLDVILDSDESLHCPKVDGSSSVLFWVDYDPLCGAFSVDLGNQGSKNLTRYYETRPGCGAPGCATFENLDAGIYAYKIHCGNVEYNTGTIEVSGGPECKLVKIS